jgi:von Willebrand factor type A domain
MSRHRRAARRAGALSLGLHAALVAGLVAALGRPGPVGAPARGGKVTQDVGVVALAAPEVKPTPVQPQIVPAQPPAAPAPPVVATPAPAAPPPLPVAIIKTLPGNDVRPVAPSAPASPPIVTPVAHAPGPPDPPGAATRFFDVPAVGRSVVYVIDRSSSMGVDGRFDRARDQVVASIQQLPADARFQVIAYDKGALALRLGDGGGLAAATPANVAAAVAALEAMAPEGGSEHLKALGVALSLRPDVIYFLTDEDDLTPAHVREVKRLNGGRVSIHAFCLVPPPAGDTPLRVLARENRGQFRVVR